MKPNTKTNKKATPVAKQATPVAKQATPVAKDTPKAATPATKPVQAKHSLSGQIQALIEGAGSNGIGAVALATQLNLIEADTQPGDRILILKKVRSIARKVSGGAADKRDGRNAVYTLSTDKN